MSLLQKHGGDLQRAFTDGALGFLHVDLENMFYKPGRTDGAFTAANNLACYARDIGVPNYWAMYTARWHIGTVEGYKSHHLGVYEFHSSIQPGPRDIVFEKHGQGLFDSPCESAAVTLDADRIDTVIITGVYHDMCVADTIRGALNEGLRVYAVADATDCSPDQYEFMGREILKPVSRHIHNRLSITTLSLVRQVLAPMAEIACPFSPRDSRKISLG